MADGDNMRVTEEGVVWEESSRGKEAPPSPPLPPPPPPPKEENKESLLPQKRRKIKETTHSNRESEGMMGLSPTTRTGCGNHYSSEESALDHDPSLMSGGHNSNRRSTSESPALASGTQHSESSSAAACFRWPPSSWLHGTVEERSAYFSGLQKRLVSDIEQREPSGQQATTLLDLMTIRAFHSKVLRRFSLGTAVGFRTRRGLLTNIPAIIVFVARKVHKEWLDQIQRLPTVLEGPGGIWCNVDVVEFSCYGASAPTHKEQVYTELVEGLRGNDPFIGPGSQVASQETYGTLGAIVQSRTGARQVGFLTNRHVAVNLDYPNQKMFHPLPPNLGPGVYLGAVERATSFITDDLWYGIFASTNSETFVRADGAFIPFADYFDISKVTTSVKEVGETGDVMVVDLQAAIGSIVGKRVAKVGRSSGLTTGSIMAYALEYNDEKGICVFTDFLIVGENGQTFDLEGDSGSLILMMGENGEKPKPIGIIWGGTSNRGRLRLRNGHAPENWTSGVDLCRLLDLLQLALITNDAALEEAIEEQRRWSTGLAMGSTVGESSPGGRGGPLLELDMEMPEGGRRPTLVVEEEIPSFIPVDARSQREEGDFGHNNSEREELVSGLGHNCSEREELASGLGHNNSELGLNLGGEEALASSSAALPVVELELMEFGFRLPPPTNNPKEAESGVFDAPADEDREDLSIRLNSFDNNREGKRLWPLEP